MSGQVSRKFPWNVYSLFKEGRGGGERVRGRRKKKEKEEKEKGSRKRRGRKEKTQQVVQMVLNYSKLRNIREKLNFITA